MSLEHRAVLENKKALLGKKAPNSGSVAKSEGSQWKGFQWPKLEQFEQPNKVVLDYNTKYRINIHKSI